jgi:hypothetical protein
LSKVNSIIQFAANKIKGKIAEDLAKTDYIANGFTIQQTGIGSDFIAIKKSANVIYKEYVDVKSGNATLTKKQKETKSILRKYDIPYTVYRVTDKHLKFQIKHNSELQNCWKKIDLDVSKFTGNFIIVDSTTCPNCKLFANGFDSIFINFGLRNMGNGSVRVQSWCKNCRNYSRGNI